MENYTHTVWRAASFSLSIAMRQLVLRPLSTFFVLYNCTCICHMRLDTQKNFILFVSFGSRNNNGHNLDCRSLEDSALCIRHCSCNSGSVSPQISRQSYFRRASRRHRHNERTSFGGRVAKADSKSRCCVWYAMQSTRGPGCGDNVCASAGDPDACTIRNHLTQSIYLARTGSNIGLPRRIITIHPDNVEHILKRTYQFVKLRTRDAHAAVILDNFENYVKGPEFNAATDDLLGHGIFNANGEQWKYQRKAASFIFNVKNFRDHFTESVQCNRIMYSSLRLTRLFHAAFLSRKSNALPRSSLT